MPILARSSAKPKKPCRLPGILSMAQSEVGCPKAAADLLKKSEAAKKIEAEIEAKRIAARQRFEAGCERYEKLLAFCKEHKIKGVRSGLRMATLLNKIEAAGLKFEF